MESLAGKINKEINKSFLKGYMSYITSLNIQIYIQYQTYLLDDDNC